MRHVRSEVRFDLSANSNDLELTNVMFAEVENRLIETYMKHQQHIEPNGKSMTWPTCSREMLTHPSELKATLQASLQAKVATLEEDKWMFEKDDSPPQ